MVTDYIKPSVYRKIYQLMEYENALALRTSLETGMRIGDVLALTPDCIEGRTINYTAQKTGKPAKKVISADLAKRLRRISDKNFVFPGRFGDKPRCRQTVWKDVKKASKHLKLTENVACHSARKTYAVEVFQEKGLPSVQKELQHTHGDTSLIYAFADMFTAQKHGDATQSSIDVERLAVAIATEVVKQLEQMFRIDEDGTLRYNEKKD